VIMTAERWQRVKVLYSDALEVAVEDRESFISSACGRDPDLAGELRRLLAAGDSDGFLDEPLSLLPDLTSALSDSEQAFAPGDRLCERFEIVRFIARGGMGEVYEAQDSELQETVALKTIRPEIGANPLATDLFRREVRRARAISSQHVCRVHDLFTHRPSSEPPVAFLSMRLLRGETLAERIRRDGKFSAAVALPLLRQIAEGVDAAHSERIVHGDLKSRNVMLTRDENGDQSACIMDFGLARRVPLSTGESESSSDIFRHAGTPAWMAPEQVEGRPPGPQADIYALGLIAFEMVTGHLPFDGAREFPPELSANWKIALSRCLATDPSKRFESGSEFVAAIASNPSRWSARHRIARRAGWSAAIAALLLIPAAILAYLALEPVTTSVGVYEIENQTNDSRYDYLCKGTTNELMRRLTHLAGVRVIPMHAARSKSPQRNPGQFALDGMLQAHNGQVRLSVLVTDNKDGTLVWSENFDRKQIEDPLEIQSDIASGTVIALEKQVILGGAGAGVKWRALAPVVSPLRKLFATTSNAQVKTSPTTSNLALDHYMRGRELLEKATPGTILAAIDQLKRALAEDPAFALAYAALADAHLGMMDYNYLRAKELLSNARKYAEIAVSLNPNLAEAHDALGRVRQTAWEWKGAEESFLTALRLKPSLATARRRYADLLMRFGRIDEGIDQARQSFEQDPYDQSAPQGYGLYLFFAEKYQEALAVLEPAAQGKDAIGPCHNLGDVYVRLAGSSSRAEREQYFRKAFEQADRVTEIEKRLRPDPRIGTPWGDQMHATYYSLRGDSRTAEPYLKRMRLDMEAGSISPTIVAFVYAVQGKNAKALDLLERAAASGDDYVTYSNLMPFLENLRGEPRFKKLLARMHL
jgi:serine/threonine protein kinase/tetratricopeptide (TPR) repeat protein